MPPRSDLFRFRQKTARVRAPLLRAVAAERGYTAGPAVDRRGQQGSGRRKLFINHRGVYSVVGFNGRARQDARSPSRIAVSGATHRRDRIVSAETLLNARADSNAPPIPKVGETPRRRTPKLLRGREGERESVGASRRALRMFLIGAFQSACNFVAARCGSIRRLTRQVAR